MFNFRNRDQLVPSVLSLVAVLLLAATFVYMLVVPPPSVAGIAKGRERSKQQLQTEIARAKETVKTANEDAADRYWRGDPDGVLAEVLAQMNKRTGAYKLSMAAFRPQRSRVLGRLTELPCSVQVTGPYPTVVAFLGALDKDQTRIVVRSAQISSADGTTGQVTATLGFSVYVTAGAPAPQTQTAGKRDVNHG